MAVPVNPTVVAHSAVTQFVGDGPIPAGTIAKYQYGFGQTSGQYTLIKDDVDFTTDATGKQFFTIPSLPAFGNWFAAARAVTKDVPPAVAAWGNEVAFATVAKEPKPISDFSVGQ